MMNDDEMIELVSKCSDAVLEIMTGVQMTGDDITTFWAILIGNVSKMVYETTPKAVPWAACTLTAGKLQFVAEKLREEHEDERGTESKEL